MLGAVEWPMDRLHQLALFAPGRSRIRALLASVRRTSVIAFIACAGCMSLLHAQNSPSAPPQQTPAALPAAPDALPDAGLPSSLQNRAQAPASSWEARNGTIRGVRFLLDPIQAGVNFGNVSATAGN